MTDVPDWVTIGDGEEVVWQSKPSLTPYVLSLAGEVVLIALGLVVWVTGGLASLTGLSFDPEISVLSLSFWAVVGLGLIAWGGLGILSTGLGWWSHHYVVTTEEIYKKTGLVSRSVKNARLSDVQNTTFSQSVLGRLGSYGTVEVYTAGTGSREIGFEHAPDPESVVSRITEQRSTAGS